MERTLAVYDHFVKDPDLMRSESRALSYARSRVSPSNLVSARSRYATRLARQLSRLTDRPVDWSWKDGAGTYRTTTRADVARTGNAFFAHSDGIVDFVCLLYLSPEDECHGGTAFYRHKATGLDGFHDLDAVQRVIDRADVTFRELSALMDRDARVPRRWIRTDMVQMRPNRLVVYNGRLFHSHVFDFAKVRRGRRRLSYVCFGTRRRPA